MYGLSFEGKTAIVTGAARGIGREYAAALAGSGASVVVADLLDEAGAETVSIIEKEGGKALYLHTDVTSEQGVQAMVDKAVGAFGEVSILVNNAARYGGLPNVALRDVEMDRWRSVLDVNLASVFLVSKIVAPAIAYAGGGVIVNQASIGAYLQDARMADYCASKAAVIALTKSLAKEYARDNIRVNAIAPGGIYTDATLERVTDEIQRSAVSRQCIARAGMPEDLIGPLLFLCGDMSSFMTGQTLVIDGGMVMPA